MPERTLKCPQCSGPLRGGAFTRSTVCPFCGATVVLDEERTVSTDRFRAAHRQWNDPETHGYTRWVTVDGGHWALGDAVARGEISDVFYGERARWPTERVLVKILRDPDRGDRFDHEWQALAALRGSSARGVETFNQRLPRPVARGTVGGGRHAGARAMLFAWRDGFHHSLETVRRVHPGGVEPRSAIWVWRRILEVLSFVHGAGMVHGAVLPPHLLVQDGEHGVLLVGYSRADEAGSSSGRSPDFVVAGHEDFYPRAFHRSKAVTPALDVAMSARAVASLLGGDPDGRSLPDRVPEPLAREVRARCEPGRRGLAGGAWDLHQRLGTLARKVFGRPVFCPIDLPSPPVPTVRGS